MNQEKVLKTILAPIVSEKTSRLAAHNQYAFRVRPDSTKREVKAAVEKLFNVDVEMVTSANVKGKKKITKGRAGRRINWKKATVSIAAGQMIDVGAA